MRGWAKYWERKDHTPKPLCSQVYCLDSFLFDGEPKRLWIPLIDVCAWLKDGWFVGNCKGMPFSLRVVAQRCNYGGHRYFFLCTTCSARMKKVYFAHGAFHCRKCLNLGHHSQRLRACDGFIRMKWKIIESLEIKHGSQYKRPRRMWNKTFEKIQKRIDDISWRADMAFDKDHPRVARELARELSSIEV